MADAYRKTSVDLASAKRLEPEVLSASNRYAFFELLRRLRQKGVTHQELRDLVRVRPHLSLGFPDSDIESVSIDEEGLYHIEANFFGLYGVSSPLPTFYTEDLIEEAMRGDAAMRDFIDILHTVLYPLLYQAWEKYRLWLSVVEHGEEKRLQQLLALIGFRDLPSWRNEALELLPFAGNLSVGVRSALGLEALLKGLLGYERVVVHTCVEQRTTIPSEARTYLGLSANQLGEETVLGSEIKEVRSKIQIEIVALQAERFTALLPFSPLFLLIQRVLSWYSPSAIQAELLLWLEMTQRQPACLGHGWGQLGLNTWLGAEHQAPLPLLPVRFQLSTRSHTYAAH